ncbi:MAG: MtrB/PioB family outer membrane beta-barrel protein [Nitrosospira sp.]|nr:MtrB/PioB family outer membrane beta-barrel protein [Nitrosospira sp.]
MQKPPGGGLAPNHRSDWGDIREAWIKMKVLSRGTNCVGCELRVANTACCSPPGVGGSLHGRVDTTLRLFVKYAIQKNMGLRLDYIYNRFKTDEWTWASRTYTDGTRLSQNPNQAISFVGLSGYYNW